MPIKLSEVSYTYSSSPSPESRFALENVSLEIGEGEFVGVMGRSGSGKTTLARLIAGLIKPSAGQILVDGEDINAKKYDRRALRGRVGLVFQNPARQLFETSVERELVFAPRRLGLSPDEAAKAAERAAELVGLDYGAVRDKSPLALNRDERRRVAVAGVLAASPDILIFDEPTIGLDSSARQSFLNMAAELNKRGNTVIMISRDADALADCAGRVLVLSDGALIRDGNTRFIFSDYYDLLRCGAEAPRVREAAQLLRERGVNMPTNIISYGEFTDRLKIIMWRKNV